MLKRFAAVIYIIALASPRSFCDEKAHPLGRIVVTPSRIESPGSSGSRSAASLDDKALDAAVCDSIQDAIGEIGGIDLRRRGPEGVQADVSIRGTTFEQNTVMIDGVRINDPQTGHFNLDIPLTVLDAERIEIMKGPASSLYGANSFGGVINVITKKTREDKGQLEAKGVSFDYFDGAFSVSSVSGPLSNRLSFQNSRSSGYMPETEFKNIILSDSVGLQTPFGGWNFLFGYLKKDFGADSFYSNLYPNEEEHTDTRFFKLETPVEAGDTVITPRIFLRRHRDKFALDRNKPGWQTNYHTTYNYGVDVNMAMVNPFADVSCGFELSRDTIDSTSLQTHSRTTDAFYMEISPHLFKNLYVNASLRADYFSDFGLEVSPTVTASYALGNVTVRGLAGRAYRVPTFTDLYYNDAANVGNAGLSPESSWSYEAGAALSLEPLSLSATYFHRDSYDTIDWTRTNPSSVWRASNIGSVNTNGIEAGLELATSKIYKGLPVERFFLSYTFTDNYSKHDYFSKYALDYLKQHICAGLTLDVAGIKNHWVLNYKKRVGDSGYVVVDTKISRQIFREKALRIEAFLEISNLFDEAYSEQSNIPMPGRWIKAGGRVEF